MCDRTPGRSLHNRSATARTRCGRGCREGETVTTAAMLNGETAPRFQRLRPEREGAMTVRPLVTCVTILVLSFAVGSPVRAESSLTLPTPRSHYQTFTPGISGLPLLQNLVQGLDPQTRITVLTFVASSHLLNGGSMADLSSPDASALLNMARAAGISEQTTLSKEQALARLKELNWSPWKPLLLEFVVHQSQVFEIIPAKSQPFLYPIVHDSLLYFLDHLPEDRLLEKLVDIAYLPAGSSRSALRLLLRRLQAFRNSGRSLPEINLCLQSIGRRSSNLRTVSTR